MMWSSGGGVEHEPASSSSRASVSKRPCSLLVRDRSTTMWLLLGADDVGVGGDRAECTAANDDHGQRSRRPVIDVPLNVAGLLKRASSSLCRLSSVVPGSLGPSTP